jgi:predicted DNA-binding protein
MANQMIVRIDPDLKTKVGHLAKVEGKSVSAVVRELLEDYVKNRDMGSYIDDLWDRMGNKIKSRGFSRKDLSRILREVRTKR